MSGNDLLEELRKRKLTTQKVFEDDIAPVTQERSWFQAGALDDDAPWYENIAKTIIGTGRDVGEHATQGALGIGETLVDTMAFLAPVVQQVQYQDQLSFSPEADKQFQQQNQRLKQDVSAFIAQDIINEEKIAKTILMSDLFTDLTGINPETDSVLGERSDALVESAGRMAAQFALGQVGVPWFVTSAVSSFGGEAQNAFQQGATFEEAGLSATVSAAAETLSEKLFGGDLFTKKAGMDLATNALSRGISDKVLRNLAKLGIDTAGEGFEELFSQVVSNLGSALYKEENLGEILFNEEALNEYLESFIGGTVMGGGMGVINVAQSNANGVDYTTGLTENEQKVVDKLYKDAVAERGNVSQSEKAKIYEDIRNQMEKGYLSTDAIEEVLGEESYKAYRDVVDSEESLVKQEKELTDEYNALSKKVWRDMTGEEHDRREELKTLLPELRTKIQENQSSDTRNQLKSQLGKNVMDLVKGENKGKGSRLLESYNERGRAFEDFQADYSKFEGKKHTDAAKKTLESAIAAGANNTNRVHDLVDMAAQVSADTGKVFTFKSGDQIKADFVKRQTGEIAKLEKIQERTKEQNQKLADMKDLLQKVKSGEVVVDGDITADGIVLNLDSAKPLNRVVGHEITHSFEPGKGKTSQEYTELKDSLFAYAKSKKIDLKSKLKEKQLQYEGVADADPEAELVADLVGDFLFTDSNFVKQLSVENRNVFQRMWDKVKHLYKMATAGSKEARELERVKKAFEDAYRESATKNTAKSGVKYSITDKFVDSNGTSFDSAVLLDTGFFDGLNPRNWGKKLRDFVDMRSDSDPFILPVADESGNIQQLQFANVHDRVTKNGKSNHKVLDKLSSGPDNISKLAVVHIDEIVEVSDSDTPYHTTDNNHQWLDQNGWLHRTANVINAKNGNIYNLTLDIAKAQDGRHILYATNGNIKKVGNVQVNSLKIKGSGQNSNSTNNLSQTDTTVKRKDLEYQYAVKHGDMDTAQKMVDEAAKKAGYSTKGYHGSRTPGFTVVEKYSWLWFARDEAVANGYGISEEIDNNGKPHNKKGVYTMLYNLGNNLEVYANGASWGELPVTEGEYPGVYVDEDTGDITTNAMAEWAERNGYDSITFVDVDDGGLTTVDVVFNPNRNAKSADPVTYDDSGNVIPLSERFNPENNDIRYSISDSSGKQLTQEQAEYFKDSKAVDANGNLQIVYHGTRNADFTVFKRNVNFFTDSKEMADSYSPNGAMYEGYVNITKPYEIDAKGEKWSKIPIDDATRKFLQEYGASVFEEGGKWRTTPADIASAIEEAVDNGDMDYDGIIIRNIDDTGSYYKGKGSHLATDYIVFNSNQFKNVDNKKPTTDPDIRRSLSNNGKEFAPSRNDVYGRDFRVKPVETVSKSESVATADISKMETTTKDAASASLQEKRRLLKIEQENLDAMTGNLDYDFERMDAQRNIQKLEAEISELENIQNAETTAGSSADKIAPVPATATTDIAPVKTVPKQDLPNGIEERSWYETSTKSEAVDGAFTQDDIPDALRYYKVKSNKKSLESANAMLEEKGFEKSVEYFGNRFDSRDLTTEDLVLGQRLIQEAIKKGDLETAMRLDIDTAIIGTELGQMVQSLSVIQRLTPEGQLRTLTRVIRRGKKKGDKAYEGVELTAEDAKIITDVQKDDGTFDQDELNAAVETVKQRIADRMKVTFGDYVNEWRYLSMLGNPKTHIRNIVSNAAMAVTRYSKDVLARTAEDLFVKDNRTKTWKRSSDAVREFAKQTLQEMEGEITGDKYSESGSIKAKRKVFKTKVGNFLADANSKALAWEDSLFSKFAFRQYFQEYLTANGIVTEADIQNSGKIIADAKQYALKMAKEATFQQNSYIANKIGEIERKNPLFGIAIGATLPFKKTPINIAKTAAAYSPLGFARNVYDAVKVAKGEMNASEAVDHLAQTLTGTSLTLIGFYLASMGILNGAGDDDKEGKYDYQLGEQAYSFNFDGDTFSLSWLSPVAMPLFVGTNFYEQLVEDKDWNMNVVSDALAKTLDPLSEMSFLSGLSDVLSSYDSGMAAFGGMIESAGQSYISQFVPTLSSQIAATLDDTKRSTKVSKDSAWSYGEEVLNQIMYKIPGLREKLEPSTDIWGNEVKQTEDEAVRAIESFFAPYSKREGIATEVDAELKDLYSQTGDTGLLPSVPYNYFDYKGEKYKMSASEHTQFKKTYGQTASELMAQLFQTESYQNADAKTKADMVNHVYDYARDTARMEYLSSNGVNYTNATKDGNAYYKEDPIRGAIEMDMTLDEYRYYLENPGKHSLSKVISDNFATYDRYRTELSKIQSDQDAFGETITGSAKAKKVSYINGLDLDYGQKLILYKSQYKGDDTYNYAIVDYLNNRDDISYEDMKTILTELGFIVFANGSIAW